MMPMIAIWRIFNPSKSKYNKLDANGKNATMPPQTLNFVFLGGV
jgi:hypothetical protein